MKTAAYVLRVAVKNNYFLKYDIILLTVSPSVKWELKF